MITIKEHLSGVAIAYRALPRRLTKSPFPPQEGRPQGSLYNQQKRKIADACEYMRRHGKALIFVVTSPGHVGTADEKKLISKFTANLRNGYKVRHYVWVREYTKKGFPHFHFVADAKFLPAKKLSIYWSSLFGVSATNCVRLGTAPAPGKKRTYFLKSERMARYLCKYLGKSIGEGETTARVRRFHVSQELAKLSQPLIYGEEIVESKWTKLHSRVFVLSNVDAAEFYEQGRAPPEFQPRDWSWKWTGHGDTYIGIKKKEVKTKKNKT